MTAAGVLIALAETYDRHARDHAPDNRCGCDLCEWIESAPGVLQAIASVTLGQSHQCLGSLELGTTRYRCQVRMPKGVGTHDETSHTFAVSALDMRVQWRAPTVANRDGLGTLFKP